MKDKILPYVDKCAHVSIWVTFQLNASNCTYVIDAYFNL